MKNVAFLVDLKDGVDPKGVMTDLEKLASDIKLWPVGNDIITGNAPQKTYEIIFDAKVKYVTNTIQNINRGAYQVKE